MSLFYNCFKRKCNVALCDIPELFLRTALVNILNPKRIKDSFDYLLSIKDTTKYHGRLDSFLLKNLPFVFYSARRTIIPLFIDCLTQNFTEIIAVMGIDEFEETKRMIKLIDKEVTNLSSMKSEFQSVEEENIEKVIEAHVLLDIMFETQVWREPYVTNPFAYLNQTGKDITPEEVKKYTRIFSSYYKKYNEIIKTKFQLEKNTVPVHNKIKILFDKAMDREVKSVK